MTGTEGLLDVGRVGRPHGIRGDVFINLTTDRTERAAVGTRLLIGKQWYTIEQSAASNGRWRVHLGGVDLRDSAAALTGQAIYAEPIDDPDVLWVHKLRGARVVDIDGVERGTCVAVIDNPAADILELESGALVPATFITSFDADAALITVDPPDGLFELYESESASKAGSASPSES